jgi:hypothetical protein
MTTRLVEPTNFSTDTVGADSLLEGSGFEPLVARPCKPFRSQPAARRRGCGAGVLYTISFQAPEFYKRIGWRVFGEILCDPPGTSGILAKSKALGS